MRAKTRPFTPDQHEILFYQQLASEIPLCIPQCYYSAMNVTDGKYVRILEDLAPAKAGDQIRGSTAKETALALRAIASFHAYWWKNEKLTLMTRPSRIAMQNPMEFSDGTIAIRT